MIPGNQFNTITINQINKNGGPTRLSKMGSSSDQTFHGHLGNSNVNGYAFCGGITSRFELPKAMHNKINAIIHNC